MCARIGDTTVLRSVSTSSSSGWFSPAMLCRSLAQSPKSISLQRCEQNGRQGLASVQGTRFMQVGQLTCSVRVFKGDPLSW